MAASSPALPSGRPPVSILLIAYNQQDTIVEAVAGALSQSYQPLEIVISDDASTDGTWKCIQAAVSDYRGPHTLRLNRNERNLGVGAHLSRLAAMAHGELLFVAAGDDVSLPERCELVVRAWLDRDRKPDLIACHLIDIDKSGNACGRIAPSDLQEWRSLTDWVAHPPVVVGAAQAWTRRLFARFGPLPEGTVAEDLVMVFRALGTGGAVTLAEPLVRYRRGGLSGRVRARSAADVVRRTIRNNRHALVETEQMLRDAEQMDRLNEVGSVLHAKLEREHFIASLFSAGSVARCAQISVRARHVPVALRMRLFVYAAMPWLLAPVFALKRVLLKD